MLTRQRVVAWVAPLVAALTAVLLFAAFAGRSYDDPFITYRYADNLSRGLGFVYNPGERVLSTTTPLFTLLLAGLGWLWGDLPGLASLLGALGLAAGALCLWDLAHTWQAPIAGWVCLLLYPTIPLLLGTIGSESPFYLALCLGAFALYARGHFVWAAACAALATLARADGIIVAGLIAAGCLLQWRQEGRALPWGAAGMFLALTVPWFLFSIWYFGSPFPATLAAKQRQGALAISTTFGPGVFVILERYFSRWPQWVEAGLALTGVIFALAGARRWLLFLLWPVVYFFAYSALGVSRYYWYYAPLVPGFVAAAGLGVEWAWGWTVRVWPGERRTFRTVGIVGLAALVLGQGLGAFRMSRQVDNRMAIYRAAGEWLNEHTSPQASVGALEVGAIGYYAGRPMVDFAGLLQPDIAAQLTPAATYEDAARWGIQHYRPDYLVLNPAQFPALIEQVVEPDCQTAHSLAGADYGYPGELVIYECVRGE